MLNAVMNNNSQQTIKEIKQKGNWYTVVFPNGDTMKVSGKNNLEVLKRQLNIQRTYTGELSQKDVDMLSLLEKHRDCPAVKNLIAQKTAEYRQALIETRKELEQSVTDRQTLTRKVDALERQNNYFRRKAN